jgi:hypothetical protein
MKYPSTPSIWAQRALLTGIVAASLTACKKDKEESPTPTPPPVNEEELITTLILTFTDTAATPDASYELRWTDLDGPGGNDPVQSGVPLPASRELVLDVRVLNESETPAEEITDEIRAEDEDHQFFYQSTGGLVTVYADADGDGNPIGLRNRATTPAAGSGTITAILRHMPNKSAAGVASGDITNAGGDTDIEVDLNFTIQ